MGQVMRMRNYRVVLVAVSILIVSVSLGLKLTEVGVSIANRK